jgi:hypothetical protein
MVMSENYLMNGRSVGSRGASGLRRIRALSAKAGLCLVAGLWLGACSGGDSDGGDAPGLALESGVAYVKRNIPTDDNGNALGDDVRDPYAFNPGAALYVRNRLAANSPERLVTGDLFPPDENGNPARYDVKDISVSYDGSKILFALHGPEIEDADDDEQHTWDIYQYDVASGVVTRLTGDASDFSRIDRAGHDIAPRYLRDGRIVFASTRQKRSQELLLDEGKPPFPAQVEAGGSDAVNLHVMDADGSNIRQLTFNQSHDLDPYVLADGRIVFTRWDNMAGRNRMSLYTINPDGTGLSMLYGYNSHATGPDGAAIQFVNPVQAADGSIIVNARPFRSQQFGGDLLAIRADTHSDISMRIDGSADADAQGQARVVADEVRIDGRISPGGRFISAFPLLDGTDRLLVGYHQCLLEDEQGLAHPCTAENLARAEPDATTGAPAELREIEASYGMWLLDPSDATMRPLLIERDVIVSEAVPVLSREAPQFIPDKALGDTGIDECACRDDLAACGRGLDEQAYLASTGILDIRSVYDLDGADAARDAGSRATSIDVLRDPARVTADQRGVRFIRLEKPVSLPDDDVFDFNRTAFGPAGVMREIIGYGVVEPDGSVKVRVPAGIAFTFSLLDASGRRIQSVARHNNWLQVQAGETLTCHGCHDPSPGGGRPPLPHGRLDAQRASANPGAPADGLPFPNTEAALTARACETMAATATRHDGVSNPLPDLLFNDIWTDPGVRAKDPAIAVRFADLVVEATAEEAEAGLTDEQVRALRTPVALNCLDTATWNAGCRTVINYEAHIQPIWQRTRLITDDMNNVILDQTCTSCHSKTDAMGNAQLPAGQLELTPDDSDQQPAYMTSYRELLYADAEEELVVDADTNEASVRNVEIEVPRVDGNGNPVLDEQGQQIIDLVTVPVSAPMSAAGANASTRFFSRVETTSTVDVHYQALAPVELKLIAEWLDIGAQYYNNPFDAPAN